LVGRRRRPRDGLVAFPGEPVPATGFRVGVSRLAAAMAASEGASIDGPVLVLVLDQAEIADYCADGGAAVGWHTR
jgi:histidyl-tRNA synthetase